MSKPVREGASKGPWSCYSKLSSEEQSSNLSECAALTSKVFDGLDLASEIRAIAEQQLGETILLEDESGLAGFAVCHIGKGSEAGTGNLFVKFGVVRPGQGAPVRFARVIRAYGAVAAEARWRLSIAGVDAAPHSDERHTSG